MSIELPKPISAFIEANARLDLEGMLDPFTPDAVVLDNGKRFEGRDGIRKLLEEAVIPVRAIFTPDCAQYGDDQIVVEGPAHGDFPGSPIRFTYRFAIEGGSIKTLEIEA